uniref:Uncharacterized protein n=1 Tax=Rhizophora mucronata TaxID=61149 RepID=A0A2P2PN03_RHIMU
MICGLVVLLLDPWEFLLFILQLFQYAGPVLI